MKKFLAFGAAALAVFAVPATLAAMPPAHAWDIGPVIRGKNYSVGMPATPRADARGGLTFEFPQVGRGEVDAMTTDIRSLRGAREITMVYRVDATRGTRFVPSEQRDRPATVSIYFQRRGDNWSGRGRYGSYRWYVPGRAVLPITPGTHRVTIRLDERWTNVNGRPNTEDRAGFEAALAEASKIGVAFGTSGRRSHGVAATGPARFTLLSLDIT